MKRHGLGWAGLGLGLLGASGCQIGGEGAGFGRCGDDTCLGDENYLQCPADCELPGALQGDLTPCASELPQADINEQLFILLDVDQSMHEMVACGGMIFAWAEAVGSIGIDLALAAITMRPPSGYVYRDGDYVTSPDGVMEMRVTALYGSGFDGGEQGVPLGHDLFDLDNYVLNPRLEIDYAARELLIRHDGKGPLVELLGYGSSPGRPIRIGLDDISPGRFHDLQVRAFIPIADDQELTTVVYELGWGPHPVGDLLQQGTLGFALDAFTAQRRRVEADTTRWDITYAEAPAALDGEVDVDVYGGAFDVRATMRWQNSGYADVIEVECARE